MSPFLLYIARAGLYLSLFYAFYLLVMRYTTFFRLNRVLILTGSYVCLLLPLIRLRMATEVIVAENMTMVAAGPETAGINAVTPFPWQEILLALYITGALVTLTLHGISACKMMRLIRKGERFVREGCRLIIMEEDIPSFSWGRSVVISRRDLEENPAIFTHECMHVQCRHSLDLLLLLPLQLLFWWNPLVWITREELRLMHEYEADEGVIQKGIDATQYQLLLVRKAVGEQRFSLASGFRHSKLKNRIAMMLKPTSSRWMRWSYLALIPVLAAFMYACNPPEDSQTPESLPTTTKAGADIHNDAEAVPFSVVEVKPSFQGGDSNEFVKWVNEQLKDPKKAIEDKVEGRVTLKFTVDTDGSVRDVTVLRGIREDIDEAAKQIVCSSPKWTPGKHADGTAVPVTFIFPVIFMLK